MLAPNDSEQFKIRQRFHQALARECELIWINKLCLLDALMLRNRSVRKF